MIRDFDISHYLDSKEMIAEYLSQVLANRDMNELLSAIGNIAKAKGMLQVAKDTNDYDNIKKYCNKYFTP